MPFINRWGSDVITIPAGNKFGAYSPTPFKVYQWIEDSRNPDAFKFIAYVKADTPHVSGFYSRTTKIRLDASEADILVDIGKDPSAISLYSQSSVPAGNDEPSEYTFAIYSNGASGSYSFTHRILSTSNYTSYDLDQNYYLFSTDTEDYYVWYNIDDTGIDPALPGRVGLELVASTSAPAASVLSATEEALLLTVPGITVTRINNVVIQVTIDNNVPVAHALVSPFTNPNDVIEPVTEDGIHKWFASGPDENILSCFGPFSVRVGIDAIAGNIGAVAIGHYAQAKENSSMALGLYAYAGGLSAVAIGPDAFVASQGSVAIGSRATTSDNFSIAIGQGSHANALRNIAIGNTSLASDDEGISIGFQATSSGLSAMSIGNVTVCSAENGIAIGNGSLVEGEGSIVIGEGAANTGVGATFGTVIGTEATCDFTLGVAIGYQSASNSVANISVGYQAITGGSVSIGIGNLTNTGTSATNIALGHVVTIGDAFTSCICLGNVSNPTASNQMVIGSGAHVINTMYLGKGVQTGTAPTATTISATEGTGTNIGGGILNIRGGVGTGSSTPGALRLQSATAGASGTTKQTAVTRFEVNGTGIGFFATSPVAKQTITGSRAGNAALASLLTALNTMGLVTNSSSA